MNYTIEKYADFKRFNQQYEEIYQRQQTQAIMSIFTGDVLNG